MKRLPATAAALAGLAVLALPPVRRLLESSMSLHMLVQFPLVVAAGYFLARALPTAWRRHVDGWNAHGIAGLLACALTLMVLMIPRLLDLVLVDARAEAAKWLALLACGAALQLSWRRAGLLVQAFFLGNLLPMMAAAGQLYQDAPLRLCNAYLLDDQVRLGQGLVILSVLGAIGAIAVGLRRAKLWPARASA
ncbi:hypothetical protein [Ramlibacter sp. AN1133]|uniref:hypothetical protein n=1 Tax=Ramlibacter sp. AN1133 TaxID=3133429 RepID=UPI0030C5789B